MSDQEHDWTDLRAWLNELQGDRGPDPDDDPGDFAVPLIRPAGDAAVLRRVGAERYEAFRRRVWAELGAKKERLRREAEEVRRLARYGAIKFDAPEFMQMAEEVQREANKLHEEDV